MFFLYLDMFGVNMWIIEYSRLQLLWPKNLQGEAVVNAGPAVYISPSGPNPIMVQVR